MKVGVDAVLLGAWANASNCSNVLDLGAGTGIISLMLAQKYSEIQIDAIEINKSAFQDLEINFNNSKWNNRLKAINKDYLNYDFDKKYKLIISNPPYFTPSESSISNNRKIARIADTLTPSKIFSKSNTLLIDGGKFIIIYPFELRQIVIKAAFLNGLYLLSELIISDTKISKPKRTILSFSNEFCINPKLYYINLKSTDKDIYSKEFEELTKDFYL